MYDYFLQINLAAVNQQGRDKEQREQLLDNQMSPSLLQSVVAGENFLPGGSFTGKQLSLLDPERSPDDREHLRK